MNTRIKTTDYKMPAKISDYLDERISTLEKLLGDDADATRCEVELGKAEGHHKHSEHQWFAEFQIVRPGAPRLVSRNHEATINAAIDNAKDEMMRQLRKKKTTRKSKVRRDAAKAKGMLQR